MVGIGILMILTGAIALILQLRKKLFNTEWFLYWCVLMSPAGFIAVLAGWFVTEIGRQPYIVYNLIRTSEASSPVLGQYIFVSLIAFVVVYTFIFGAGTYYIIKLIRKGPNMIKNEEIYGFHSLENPGINNA
jgi:cytochrome d ubiquinol oxidase subunit I